MALLSEFDSLMARSLKDLERLADNDFSEFIRRKYADHAGYVGCCTCMTSYHWKQISCGHYMPRRHTSTRWLITNAGPQCGTCNGPNQGESLKMAKWLDLKYGVGTSDKMIVEAHKNYKPDRIILTETIINLRKELKNVE